MINPALFSSATDQWTTPPELFAKMGHRYGPFDLDVCATAGNAKVERFYSPDQDGLQQPWQGVCWMNPPYGRTIGQWVRKAWESSVEGATVVCLLPARTDTRWWQDYVDPYADVEFLRGRVRFGDATSGAPFPSAIVIFRPMTRVACQWCEGLYAPVRTDSKFCSVACKQAAYRARKGERVTDIAVTRPVVELSMVDS